ncbi:hypothetical protein FJZ19_04365 [Candidatus Pacearchaeota archaeon]|nr:hypothetical protein [Candidatus Pacearchaeota archaeon]
MKIMKGGKMTENTKKNKINNKISVKGSINYRCINLLFIFIIFILSILFIAFIPRASAIGIIPGRTTIDFAPGLEKDVGFSVINNEQKEMQVSLKVQGELAEYITLKETSVKFLSSEDEKKFSYKMKLPEKLEPGLHTAEIVALEIPKSAEEGTFIGATVAVVSQLYVYVPCPGKCIEADLNVLDADQNMTARFIVPVINRGKTKIDEAKAEIDIYSGADKIASIETDKLPIEPGARTELTSTWFANVTRGSYLAKVRVYYDKETKTFEKEFMVGTSILDIERVWVSDFKLGGIAKFRILVENKWNQELKQVFANLLIYDKLNEIMSDLKSASEDIPSLTTKELVVYWETAGINVGEYRGKLIIKYGKKSTDRELILRVREDSLDVFGTGYAVSSEAGGLSIKTIAWIVIILLVLTNVAWFVFFKRKKSQEKNKEKK